jgi:hypothetical protein
LSTSGNSSSSGSQLARISRRLLLCTGSMMSRSPSRLMMASLPGSSNSTGMRMAWLRLLRNSRTWRGGGIGLGHGFGLPSRCRRHMPPGCLLKAEALEQARERRGRPSQFAREVAIFAIQGRVPDGGRARRLRTGLHQAFAYCGSIVSPLQVSILLRRLSWSFRRLAFQ